MVLHAATSNRNKLAEFANAASAPTGGREAISVVALPGLDTMPEPVENAATFAGNADLKAVAYSLLAPGLLVFADDSGLEVDVLGGEPGVRSARFADDADFEPVSSLPRDTRNNNLLLARLAALPPSASRAARFACALTLARDGQVLLRAEGTVEGQVLDGPRGTDGFGYDPLFLVPPLGLTLAELPREKKWELSHRGNAFRNLLAALRTET